MTCFSQTFFRIIYVLEFCARAQIFGSYYSEQNAKNDIFQIPNVFFLPYSVQYPLLSFLHSTHPYYNSKGPCAFGLRPFLPSGRAPRSPAFHQVCSINFPINARSGGNESVAWDMAAVLGVP